MSIHKQFGQYLPESWLHSPEVVYETEIKAQKMDVSELIKKVRKSVQESLPKKNSILLVGLDEAITNIAEHSLGFNSEEAIKVVIYKGVNKYAVLLFDRGEAFDPRENQSKSPKEQFEKGADRGYGMYMYKKVFEKIEYYPNCEGGNIMLLLFEGESIEIT